MNLARLSGSLILFMIIGIATAQNTKPLPSLTYNLNLAGFLQMGPIFQTELRAGHRSGYVSPYVRLPYFGVFYQAQTSEQFKNFVSPLALGLGLQYKVFVPKKMGALYLGAGADYSFGSSKAKNRSWEGEQRYLWIMATGGLRWRDIENRKVFSVGFLIGPNIALYDYKVFMDNSIINNSWNTILPMIEFSIGWER